jgi:hypothetical protein
VVVLGHAAVQKATRAPICPSCISGASAATTRSADCRPSCTRCKPHASLAKPDAAAGVTAERAPREVSAEALTSTDAPVVLPSGGLGVLLAEVELLEA